MYDLVIIGAGPGGLSAGLYAGRARLKTAILESTAIGGQIGITDSIENYPGSLLDGEESGSSLTERMKKQAEKFGCEIVNATAKDVDFSGHPKKIFLSNGEILETKGVIIATGASPRKLNVPGEAEFTSKGVSYCATCDADFFTDFEVFVVGGGNSAIEEAIYLSKFARKVTVLVRRDVLRCDAIVKEEADAVDNLEFKYSTSIKEIKGEGLVQSLVLIDNITKEEYEYFADEDDGLMGVFIFVGNDPTSKMFEGKVKLDEDGYIVTNELMQTDIPMVYAVGDIRNTPLRQVVTAASDGAIAAVYIEKDMKNIKG